MSKKENPPSNNIIISSQENLQYWCKKFNCSESVLISAVKAVGNNSKMVERFLNEKKCQQGFPAEE